MDPVFLPLDQFQNHPEPEWLVEGLLPKGYLSILASAPKAGKTCLATAIALAVATGEPFAGLQAQKAPVLWCCLEESPAERAVILKEIKFKKSNVPALFTTTHPLRIDHPSGLDILWNEIMRKQPGLIVIDPLYAAIGGYSLGENHHARKALSTFKKICNREKITGLVLHHLSAIGKTDHQTLRVAESAQLAATASMYMLLSVTSSGLAEGVAPSTPGVPRPSAPARCEGLRVEGLAPSGPNRSRTVKLECRGRGNAVNRDWFFASNGPLHYLQTTEVVKRQMNPRKAIVMQAIGRDRLPIREIVARTGLKLGSTRNLVTEMVNEDLLYVSKIESGIRFFGVTSTLEK